MKLFVFTFLLLTASLSAGLAPRKMHNEQHHSYAHKIEIKDIDGDSHHVAYHANGIVYTVLSGPSYGTQWMEDKEGNMTHFSDKVAWHDHSFTHYYPGAKVRSYKSHGAHGQTITYHHHK